MNNLELSLMTTDYHRTHPLFSGAVSIEGAKLKVCPPPVQGDACYKPYMTVAVLKWHSPGRPGALSRRAFSALPVFPLRMFIQHIILRNPEDIRDPKVKGKTVGINSIGSPRPMARGILMNATVCTIQTCAGSPPSRGAVTASPPTSIGTSERGCRVLLRKGELDAGCCRTSRIFRSGNPRTVSVRRLP